MTQALGPVEVTYVLPIGGGGAPVPWRYLTANGHTADFLNASNVVVLSASFGIDYTVTPDGDTAANAGTLTLLKAAPATATKLVLRRKTAKVQLYDATPGAEGIEAQLDRLTLVAQETEQTSGGSTLSALEALWLGPKSADPTLDNQGNALLLGAVYFNTVSLAMRVWNGAVWSNVSGAGSQPSDATLSALADLVIAANKGIYGTGPDAFATYDLTAFGRSLGGAADYIAARLLLGLGDVARYNKVTFALLDSPVVRILAGGFAGLNDIQLTTPAWVAGYAGPGKLHLLADKTVTGAPAASIDFTEFDNAVYRDYLWGLDHVLPSTNATQLWMRFASSPGVYDAGASDYRQSGYYMEDSAGPQNDGGLLSAVVVSSNSRTIGNGAGRLGVRGTVRMRSAALNTAYTEVEAETSHESSTGSYIATSLHAKRVVAQDTVAVRFMASAGNLAVSSRIRMWGLY